MPFVFERIGRWWGNNPERKVQAEQNNVEFISGEVERIILEIHNRGIKAEVEVLDPPIKGL